MIENIRMNDGTMGEAEVIKEATTVSMFPLFPPDDSLVLLRLQLQLWKLYLRSVYLVLHCVAMKKTTSNVLFYFRELY